MHKLLTGFHFCKKETNGQVNCSISSITCIKKIDRVNVYFMHTRLVRLIF